MFTKFTKCLQVKNITPVQQLNDTNNGALTVCPGVDHPAGEGSGLRSVPAQRAVPVQQRAAVRQDVHDAGRPRGRAGLLRQDHHRRSGRPEEGHAVGLRSGTPHTPAAPVWFSTSVSCCDVWFSLLTRWCSLG